MFLEPFLAEAMEVFIYPGPWKFICYALVRPVILSEAPPRELLCYTRSNWSPELIDLVIYFAGPWDGFAWNVMFM